MFKPDKFELYELLPKAFYHANFPIYGDRLWAMFDDRALYTLDRFSKRYGRIYVNNWWWEGGENQWGGYRSPDCDIGSALSQHRDGRALDPKFQEITASEVREDIIKDPFGEDFKYIMCIEDEVEWVHFDTRNHDKINDGILIVTP